MLTFPKLNFFKIFSASDVDIDAETTLVVLPVVGNIPANAEYNVKAANNGKDILSFASKETIDLTCFAANPCIQLAEARPWLVAVASGVFA